MPFLRSFGIGALLIPAVSVLAAITLLPALLALLGQRINSIRLLPKRLVDRGHAENGPWGGWARLVLRRPVAVAAASATGWGGHRAGQYLGSPGSAGAFEVGARPGVER